MYNLTYHFNVSIILELMESETAICFSLRKPEHCVCYISEAELVHMIYHGLIGVFVTEEIGTHTSVVQSTFCLECPVNALSQRVDSVDSWNDSVIERNLGRV